MTNKNFALILKDWPRRGNIVAVNGTSVGFILYTKRQQNIIKQKINGKVTSEL